MLKQALALVGLTLALSSHAAILDLGTITRDTDTGLDWLDVTETRGLSYNQVAAQLGDGGDYEGYRYATMAEWDQLIINFGIGASSRGCLWGSLHCYEGPGMSGDSPLVEQIIHTLGDTVDARFDEVSHLIAGTYYDIDFVRPDAAGGTHGIIGVHDVHGDWFVATISDFESSVRSTGQPFGDEDDVIMTVNGAVNPDDIGVLRGSFLVAPSAVPIPAAGWLFMSALIGLLGKKRLSR